MSAVSALEKQATSRAQAIVKQWHNGDGPLNLANDVSKALVDQAEASFLAGQVKGLNEARLILLTHTTREAGLARVEAERVAIQKLIAEDPELTLTDKLLGAFYRSEAYLMEQLQRRRIAFTRLLAANALFLVLAFGAGLSLGRIFWGCR